MNVEANPASGVEVRDLERDDLSDVVRIDAQHTGEPNREYWDEVFAKFLGSARGKLSVGLAAGNESGMVGYLLGEVRAFEFGSEACGWVFGIGVTPGHLREKIASRLLAESCRRFREMGVSRVRTMVLRNNIPVLSFFRANGFTAGSFAQLEVEMEDRA